MLRVASSELVVAHRLPLPDEPVALICDRRRGEH